jgi:hypothetical protein
VLANIQKGLRVALGGKKSTSAEDLVAELDKFKQAHPAVIDSYREFLEAYSKFRQLEEQMRDKRSSTLQLQHDARLPA